MILKPWNTNNIVAAFGDKTLSWNDIPSQLPTSFAIRNLKQTHSKHVFEVGQDDSSNLQGDALFTRHKHLAVAIVTADCIPLLAWGDGIVGACHAGWRGVAQNIIGEWISKMCSSSQEVNNLNIALGPSIGVCHFEVGLDVASSLGASSLNATSAVKPHPHPQKRFVDLVSIAQDQLQTAGVRRTNISISNVCTYCNEDFESYRRNGPNAGRQYSFIAMK